jgi:hypothetical protein
MNYYVFNPPSMSYINCDRFTNTSTPLVQFKVKVNPDDDIYTAIVFRDIRSMMTGLDNGSEMVFSNVPKGKKVWLVALKYEKDGPYLALQEQTTSGSPVEKLDFKKYDMVGLKDALKVLN